MRMFYAGRWQERDAQIEVRNPYDATVIDTVPKAEAKDVDAALAGAVEGAAIMRRMSGYDRYQILHKAADLMAERTRILAASSAWKRARRWPRVASK